MDKSPDDFNPESDKIIAAILAGDRNAMLEVYDDDRERFLKWSKKRFYAIEHYLDDAWQDSAIIFVEKVKSGKIKRLKCWVGTFLFAVGYWLLRKREFKEKRFFFKDKVDEEIKQIDFIYEDPWEEERQILREAMGKLSKKCQEKLTKRHYDDLTMAELEQEYQETKKRMSVDLSQCKKKLMEIIQEMLKQ